MLVNQVSRVISIACIRVLLNTGRRFVYPFAPALSRSLDVPLAAVTSILATSQFTSLLGMLLGPVADRSGYRFMMRCGLGLLACGMLLCGLVPSYWPVFAGLVIASFGKTVFDPAIQAFIGRHVPYAQRGRFVGILETAWAGSTLLGIPALGLIIDRIGLTAAFYVLALLGGCGWLYLGRVIPKESGTSEENSRQFGLWSAFRLVAQQRAALGALGFGFWISIGNDSLFVAYGAWFESAFQASLTSLGFSTMAIGLAELCGEWGTASFADRIGLGRALLVGATLACGAYLLLPLLGGSQPGAMFGMFLVFSVFEFTMVTSFSFCTELVPQARATMLSCYYAVSGVGRMLGVLAGGILWNFGGIQAVSWTSAGLMGLGIISLLWGLRGWQPPQSEP